MRDPHKERPPFKLPIKQITHDRHIENYAARLIKLIKSSIVRVLSNNAIEFDEEVRELITSVWQDGYNKGLQHMDMMHGKSNESNGKE